MFRNTIIVSLSLAKQYYLALAFLRRFCQIESGFHFFGFRDNHFLHSKVIGLASNPPTWRTKYVYLCPSVRE
jgi:hypothetical protein